MIEINIPLIEGLARFGLQRNQPLPQRFNRRGIGQRKFQFDFVAHSRLARSEVDGTWSR